MINLLELFTQSGNIQNSAGPTQSAGVSDISAYESNPEGYNKNLISRIINNLLKKNPSNNKITLSTKVFPQDANIASSSVGDLNMQ